MGERSGGGGLVDFLFNELASAFQDIRQKGVEEGWFGRVTTPEPVRTDLGWTKERGSFEALWAPREVEATAIDQDVDHGRDGVDLER